VRRDQARAHDKTSRCELVRAMKDAQVHRYMTPWFEMDYLAINTAKGWFVSPPLTIHTELGHTGRMDIGEIVAVDLKRTRIGDRDAYYLQIRENVVEWCCEGKRDRVNRKFTVYFAVACTDDGCIMPDSSHTPLVLKDLTWNP
jgi:hypothetical protein